MMYLSDFFLLQSIPMAIDFAIQPPRWRRAMRTLSMTWELTKLQSGKCAWAGKSNLDQ